MGRLGHLLTWMGAARGPGGRAATPWAEAGEVAESHVRPVKGEAGYLCRGAAATCTDLDRRFTGGARGPLSVVTWVPSRLHLSLGHDLRSHL